MPDDPTAPGDPSAPSHTVVQVGTPTVLGDPTLPPAPPGYELLGEIGAGGMGAVYRARDLALNRDVAVKLLHPRFPADSPAAKRFIEEAQITGQLQHPGIPPVHQVGSLSAGRPFLAMKLIKGHTLHDLLKERGNQTADRTRFVAVFEQICQTVAYAHARGVVHRDLKPANVMVGAFGEVQVMDWGLAKVIGTTTDPRADGTVPGTTIRSVRELGTETQAGSVLGSPAFMPPEQAGGEITRIDPRTDVFGLGAVLCVILTGQPPYTGADVNELHLKAIRGQTGEALLRLDSCGAEPELVSLCKRCLSVDPAERAADAAAVAGVIASFRADAEQRARQAELDRVRVEGELEAARMKAIEQRKRRKVQLALLASVSLLLLAGGAFAWWEDKQATAKRTEDERRQNAEQAEEDRRKAHTDREVTAALAEMNALCDRGNQEIDNPPRWRLTLGAARSAHRRAAAAMEAGPVSDELRTTFATATARLQRDEFDCETAELCEKWFVDALRSSPRSSNAAEVLQRSEAIFTRLQLPMPTVPPEVFATTLRNHRLRYQLTLLLFVADGLVEWPNRPYLTQYRRAIESNSHPLQATVQAALKNKVLLTPLLTGEVGRGLSTRELLVLFMTCRDAAHWSAEALPLLYEAARRNPADLLALVLASGVRANATFTPAGAEPSMPPPDQVVSLKYSQVRSIAASAAAVAVRPDIPSLWSMFGETLREDGLREWAIECYRRAVNLEPSRVDDHVSLAMIFLSAGRTWEAIESFRAAIPLLRPDTISRSEVPVLAAKTAILLAYDSGEETKRLTDTQRRELRREALRWIRNWLNDPRVFKEELEVLRTDSTFRFVRHPLYLATLPPDEAARWIYLWEEIRDTRPTSARTFKFVGNKIVPPELPLKQLMPEPAPAPHEK